MDWQVIRFYAGGLVMIEVVELVQVIMSLGPEEQQQVIHLIDQLIAGQQELSRQHDQLD